MANEENNNLVQLQDENGNDLNFEHLMTLEHEGNYYVLLEATEDMDDCKEGEAVILKIIRDEESDEDVYATIEDEDEFNAVFEKCMAAMEEEDAMADALELEPDEEDGDETVPGFLTELPALYQGVLPIPFASI